MIHLPFMGAKVFLQVFQVSAPLLWPLNLWLPLARRLPEACAVLCDTLDAHVSWLIRAYARRGSRRRDDDEVHRHPILDLAY
uniref:Uncharacterized protein n=1 Tax=Avena sativa TaxID=4498 RepID=A0ACD5UVC7_AVESA